MLAEIAVFALVLALCLSVVQVLGLWNTRLHMLTPAASSLTALLVFMAFVLLIVLRIDSDMSVTNVAEHSNRALPLLYKITGSWGNHEGSMLLWTAVLATVGAFLARRIHPMRTMAAGIQACLTAGALVFILATSNPFARLFPPPMDGNSLNPLLQDIALAIHPPLLYVGYVGFSGVFSLAIAGLIMGKLDRAWAGMAHPWIMIAWSSLTLGIALGSWWAYRELGWGGFWFWDPVENASLLPWLAGTALFHSNIVLKKRGSLAGWVALLSIITFGLSLLGTFLVRSGAMTSVHSFASDPTRGVYLLCYLGAAVGGGLFIYATRAPRIIASSPMRPVSREGAIVVNNLFLLTACATVLLGTLYPMLAEVITGTKLSVGAPYFNATFLPIMVVPVFIAGLVSSMPWRRALIGRTLKSAWLGWLAALATLGAVLVFVDRHAWFAAGGFALAAFLLGSSVEWLAGGRWRRPAQWPVFLGHSGAAIIIIGITGTGLWSAQAERFMRAGDIISFAGYDVQYTEEKSLDDPNYTAKRALLRVRRDGAQIAVLAPEYRTYARGINTSETAILHAANHDLYAVIGDSDAQGKTSLRLYLRPGISFVWIGACIIAAGGFCAAYIARRRRKI